MNQDKKKKQSTVTEDAVPGKKWKGKHNLSYVKFHCSLLRNKSTWQNWSVFWFPVHLLELKSKDLLSFHTSVTEVPFPVESKYSVAWLVFHKWSFSSLQKPQNETVSPRGNPTDGQLWASLFFERSFCLDVEEDHFRKRISTEQANIYLPTSIRKKCIFQ